VTCPLPSFATTQSDLSGDVGLDDEAADAGTATFEREKDLSIEQNVRDLLQKIDRALSRIDAGTYGICESCEGEITAERLKVMPFTRLCVQCQSERETEARRNRRAEDLGAFRRLGTGDVEEES